MLPGLAAAVGLGGAVVGAAVVGAVVAVRVALGAAVVGATVGWTVTEALGLDRGRTTRSGPQALTTTTAMANRRAP